MRTPREILVFAGMMIAASMLARGTAAQMPDAIAAPGETVVATLHAEGAQVYECKTESGGKLVWQFREPIATLLLDGKTVGRHYAGPTWEHGDGSAVVGKPVGRAPAATPQDIPWLRLEVTERRGSGALVGRDDGPAHPHAGRRRRRRLRQSRRVSEHPLCGRLRVPPEVGPSPRRPYVPEHQDAVQLRAARHRGRVSARRSFRSSAS